MIKEWLSSYAPNNKEEAHAALREIMQEIALGALSRAGFFEHAAFYGGTALRIFHGIDRFSEDLDFSLLEVQETFSLRNYFQPIQNEFAALGMQVIIHSKDKTKVSQVDSAFLKSDTSWNELIVENIIPQTGLSHLPHLKIKIEVDKDPPGRFDTEEKLLLRPFSCYVKCFDLPSLFAGKMHALLFRKWGENVKGRDWYDYEWYIRKGVAMNFRHFMERARASGDLAQNDLTETEFKALVNRRIQSVDMQRVKADAIRFVPDGQRLQIWSAQYFTDLTTHLKLTPA